MKKILKSLTSMLLIFAVVLTMMPLQVHAEDYPDSNLPKKKTTIYNIFYPNTTKKTSYKNTLQIADVKGKGKITKPKSSNPSVATVKSRYDKYSKRQIVTVYFKKAGKTTVSYTYEKKKYSANLVIGKYTNVVSSIKIGSTTISGNKFAKTNEISVKANKFAGKTLPIKFKLKKGWKVSDILYSSYSDPNYKECKNNQKLTFDLKDSYLQVIVYKPSSSLAISYIINLK